MNRRCALGSAVVAAVLTACSTAPPSTGATSSTASAPTSPEPTGPTGASTGTASTVALATTVAPSTTTAAADDSAPAGGLDPACLEGTWTMQPATLAALLAASFPRLSLTVTGGGVTLSFAGPTVVATARYTVELEGPDDLVFVNDVASVDTGTWSAREDGLRMDYTEREGGGSAFRLLGPEDDRTDDGGDPPFGLHLSADLPATRGGPATCSATTLTFRGTGRGADAVDVVYERT